MKNIFNLTNPVSYSECACPALPDPLIILIIGLAIGIWLGISIAILYRHHLLKKEEENNATAE